MRQKGTAAGEEEEVRWASAFRREGAASAVGGRVAGNVLDYHRPPASYGAGMNDGRSYSVYSRDACNLSSPGFYTPTKKSSQPLNSEGNQRSLLLLGELICDLLMPGG